MRSTVFILLAYASTALSSVVDIRGAEGLCEQPQVTLISPYKILYPEEGWVVRGSIAYAVDVTEKTGWSKTKYVDFFVNDELQYTDHDYPWGMMWNTRKLAPGNYTLKAIASNWCGLQSSVTQVVTVREPIVKSAANGSVVDSGLLPPIEPLIDGINIRDTTITVGHDKWYYLSGTPSDNDAWAHNEGINVWRSKDLKEWEYLGLVWSFERDGRDSEKNWWMYKDEHLFRVVWAPEFQYINGNYRIIYSLPLNGGPQYSRSRYVVSTTGKPEGPYETATGEDDYLFDNIDGSLFTDINDPTKGFVCWELGNISRLNEEWTERVGEVVTNRAGDEGCFVFHLDGKYHLSNAYFMDNGRYSSWVGWSDSPTGPFAGFHEAIPCGGHNSYFHDNCGNLWGTFFGNDKQAPWREKPAMVKMARRDDGTLYPDPDQTVPDCACAAKECREIQ